jgi:hypothetical protein
VRRGGRLTIAAPVVEMLGGGEPDWAALSTPERVMCLELLGYVVLPGAANGRCLDSVARELDALPLAEASYSCHQRYAHGVQWSLSREAQRMIDLPAVVEFATALFGDELVCTGCTYAITEPGYPGMAVHTDSQPYGSKIFGMQSSAPRLVRALTYLDGTSAQRAPLMVVPCSQLSMHVDAQPYRRYLDHPTCAPSRASPGRPSSSTSASSTPPARTSATRRGGCLRPDIGRYGPDRSPRFPSTTRRPSSSCARKCGRSSAARMSAASPSTATTARPTCRATRSASASAAGARDRLARHERAERECAL